MEQLHWITDACQRQSIRIGVTGEVDVNASICRSVCRRADGRCRTPCGIQNREHINTWQLTVSNLSAQVKVRNLTRYRAFGNRYLQLHRRVCMWLIFNTNNCTCCIGDASSPTENCLTSNREDRLCTWVHKVEVVINSIDSTIGRSCNRDAAIRLQNRNRGITSCRIGVVIFKDAKLRRRTIAVCVSA